MSLGCGACSMCCTLLHVPDIGKPAGMKCWNTGLHGGCAVQHEKETNPALAACAQYKCLWLESQSFDDPRKRHPRELRPDQSRVVMGVPGDPDDRILHVHVDPAHADAWRDPHIQYYLRDFISRGANIQIHIGKDISFNLNEHIDG